MSLIKHTLSKGKDAMKECKESVIILVFKQVNHVSSKALCY